MTKEILGTILAPTLLATPALARGDGCSKGQRSGFPSCAYTEREGVGVKVVNNCDHTIVAKWDIARGPDHMRTIPPGRESRPIGAWGAMSLRGVYCCYALSQCHDWFKAIFVNKRVLCKFE